MTVLNKGIIEENIRNKSTISEKLDLWNQLRIEHSDKALKNLFKKTQSSICRVWDGTVL